MVGDLKEKALNDMTERFKKELMEHEAAEHVEVNSDNANTDEIEDIDDEDINNMEDTMAEDDFETRMRDLKKKTEGLHDTLREEYEEGLISDKTYQELKQLMGEEAGGYEVTSDEGDEIFEEEFVEEREMSKDIPSISEDIFADDESKEVFADDEGVSGRSIEDEIMKEVLSEQMDTAKPAEAMEDELPEMPGDHFEEGHIEIGDQRPGLSDEIGELLEPLSEEPEAEMGPETPPEESLEELESKREKTERMFKMFDRQLSSGAIDEETYNRLKEVNQDKLAKINENISRAG